MEKQTSMAQWAVVVIGSVHGLTFNQWISLGVLLTGFITLIINWHYKKKHFELERQKFEVQHGQSTLRRKS